MTRPTIRFADDDEVFAYGLALLVSGLAARKAMK